MVHDLLYQECLVSRAIADRILYEAMGVIDASRRGDGKPGIPLWQRLAIYYGVRAGGWVAYRRYLRAKAAPVGPPLCPVSRQRPLPGRPRSRDS